MADKIVVLNHGKVEQIGSPSDLYSNPHNVFVAGFIGTPQMNFIEGVMASSGVVETSSYDSTVCLDVLPDSSLSPGDEVVVGIRPEQLRIDHDGSLRAIVELVEPMGGFELVTCRCGSYELRVEHRGSQAIRQGAEIGLRFDPAQAHVFGKDGIRIVPEQNGGGGSQAARS